MKKFTILASMLAFVIGKAQVFQEVNTEIGNYYYSESAIGDLNSDGKLDIAHNGAIDSNIDGNVDTTKNDVYLNSGDNFDFYWSMGNYSTHLGDIEFIDINQDGLLDMVTTGLSYNDIVNYKSYRFINTGTSFELVDDLPGKIYGGIEVVDINNDGRQDYILNGTQYVEGFGFTYDLDVYINNGTSFIHNTIPFYGTQNGDFKIVDLNNDDLLDLVITGLNGDGETITKIYENVNGEFELIQDFTSTNSDIAYADFDANGFMDLVFVGVDENYDPYLAVFFNEGEFNFVEMNLSEHALEGGGIDVGDINHDGYYDFVFNGDDLNYDAQIKAFVFNSETSGFDLYELEGVYPLGSQGYLKLFQANEDNHLDILNSGFDWSDSDMPSLTKLYFQQTSETNLAPSAPTNLNVEKNGSQFTFTWDRAADDKTPANAMQYEIRVGTTQGGAEIAQYKVTNPHWKLDLENVPNTLYWSVRAMDASKVFSEFSEENQLSSNEIISVSNIQLTPNPTHSKVIISGGNVEQVSVYSMLGQTIDVKLENNNTINLEHLNPGIYVVKIISKGIISTHKVIKK